MSFKSHPKLEPRVNLMDAAFDGIIKAMRGLERPLQNSTLAATLRELVKIRASQINGCAYCLDMHTKDARALGETEQRLYALSAWRDTPFYSGRERAALEWTERLTRLAENEVSDELCDYVREYFSEQEMVELTLAIIQINAWNRLVKPFGAVAGSYQAPKNSRNGSMAPAELVQAK